MLRPAALQHGLPGGRGDTCASVVRVFAEADVVVAPSASCVAMVREFYPYLAEQMDDADLARDVRSRPPGRRADRVPGDTPRCDGCRRLVSSRVTYHPTCHSLRALRLGDAPLALLRAVDGLDLVELPRANECCGFGGTFALKNAETSSAILDDKLDAVMETSAEVVAAVDMSCLMQIGGGLSRRGADVQTRHVAEILAAT